MLGRLDLVPALDAPELLAPAFLAALQSWPRAAEVQVAAIDADLADTAAFCSAYAIGPDVSANCVVVGRRGDAVRRAACVVLATTRVDVNGVVRRQLDAARRRSAHARRPLTRPAWSTAASRRSACPTTGRCCSMPPC